MPEKLPHDLFLRTFEHVPRVALNLVVTNPQKEVLLTMRGQQPEPDKWHFPGSYLLKGETLSACLLRIAKDELGLEIDPNDAKLLGVFEDMHGDPRGHVIDVMYGYSAPSPELQSIGDTKEMKFFSKLPEEMGFNHRDTLERLGYHST